MYLVQRCNPKACGYRDGMRVSEYMETDYMGSAEFEFGALPKSIRALCKCKLEVKTFSYINKAGLTVSFNILADESKLDEAYNQVVAYLQGDRLKEHISFRDKVEDVGVSPYARDTFWWVIDECPFSFAFSFREEYCLNFKKALAASLAYMNSRK
jgi:hypothetical protein